MKNIVLIPALEHLPKGKQESFVVKDFSYAYYPTPWHYHPEYEIVLVTESTGKRFIGNQVSDFEPGNLALIGANIPHTYKNHEDYYNGSATDKAKSIVIHFSEKSLGADFLSLPEAISIVQLLEKSMLGLEVLGATNDYVQKKLFAIVQLQGLKRWCCLLDILSELAASNELLPICNNRLEGKNDKESQRMCAVLDWITSNYDKPLKVAEAAHICNMSESAFSSFFSRRTRKTFMEYVIEIRLNEAAMLLKEKELSISSICYDSGFNNLSNFNRQFLKHFGYTPMQYKQLFGSFK